MIDISTIIIAISSAGIIGPIAKLISKLIKERSKNVSITLNYKNEKFELNGCSEKEVKDLIKIMKENQKQLKEGDMKNDI